MVGIEGLWGFQSLGQAVLHTECNPGAEPLLLIVDALWSAIQCQNKDPRVQTKLHQPHPKLAEHA